MLEQGFGDGDPKIRLAQLSEALLRDCRYVVGIKLHTQNMTVEGREVFVEKAFRSRRTRTGIAPRRLQSYLPLLHARQASRFTSCARDYRRSKGSAFSLQSSTTTS